MEKLKTPEKEKQFIFKCSQCNKMLDLSGKVFYCKNCKSNYCEDCLKGHNEIFFDHEIHQTKDEFNSQGNDKNSLLANPDLDLDDRCFSDNRLPQVNQTEEEKMFSELNILFHETLTSIEENFNEGICNIKSSKIKDNNNTNDNKIIDNTSSLNLDIEKLKCMPPLERLQKIMESINFKNK